MNHEEIGCSYMDKSVTPAIRVDLGDITAPRFASVDEAKTFFETEEGEGKGEETLLEYIHAAYDVELQRRKRDANRPDKPKSSSNVAKFKQLSQGKQEELLKAVGLL